MRRALVRRGGVTVAVGVAAAALITASQVGTSSASVTPNRSALTSTPIKHVVVIFDENVSFDHYFATYPKAANTDGVTFHASAPAPKVNNLKSAKLLTKNPNLYPPTRLRADEALTCDQNHNYGPEQKAEDGGEERPVRAERQRRHLHRTVRRARPDHGLLRRQHRHRAVELRRAVRACRTTRSARPSARRRRARST